MPPHLTFAAAVDLLPYFFLAFCGGMAFAFLVRVINDAMRERQGRGPDEPRLTVSRRKIELGIIDSPWPEESVVFYTYSDTPSARSVRNN